MTDAEASRADLEAHLERTDSGWLIRLPVRREQVSLEKRTRLGQHAVIARSQPPAQQHHGILSETGLDADPLGG